MSKSDPTGHAWWGTNTVVLADRTGHTGNEHISTSESYAHYPEYKPDLLREYENEGVSYRIDNTNVPGRVKITNSYMIDDWSTMVEYTQQLIESNPDAFSGSITGFVFEWWVHSAGYKVPFISESTKDKLASLDVGNTIYDDNHGWRSVVMYAAYFYFFPISAVSDYLIHVSNE